MKNWRALEVPVQQKIRRPGLVRTIITESNSINPALAFQHGFLECKIYVLWVGIHGWFWAHSLKFILGFLSTKRSLLLVLHCG
jgi:hypothetical protein